MGAEMSGQRRTLAVPVPPLLKCGHLPQPGGGGERGTAAEWDSNDSVTADWTEKSGRRRSRLTPGSHRMRLPVQLPLKMTEVALQNTKHTHTSSSSSGSISATLLFFLSLS